MTTEASTTTAPQEIDTAALDEVVGAGGVMIERGGNAFASQVIVRDLMVRKAGGETKDS